MNIYVKVVNQLLEMATNLKTLVAGSQEFIRFVFRLPSDWEGLSVIALFIQNGVPYLETLDNENSVYLPPLIVPGDCILVLFGSGGDVRATTNYLSLHINQNMLMDHASEVQLTQSAYAMIVQAVTGVSMTQQQYEALILDDITNILEAYRQAGVFDTVVLEDGTVSRSKVDADFEATLQKADSAMQYIPNGSVTRDMVSPEIDAILTKADTITDSIADGSIARSKVDSSFEATLQKADNAMQPSVYDLSNRRTDVYSYADNAANAVQSNLSTTNSNLATLSSEVTAARTVDNTTYASLSEAVGGALTKAKTYTDNQFLTYEPYTIVVVNALPAQGADRTFYLVPKSSGSGYEKWWYITNASGNKEWDEFGGSSTVVVTTLPNQGEADVDYILNTNGEYSYYKWISNGWHMIAGGGGEILTANNDGSIIMFGAGTPASNELDPEDFVIDNVAKSYLNTTNFSLWSVTGTTTYSWEQSSVLVANPSTNKDYYIKDPNGNWAHFRYIGNAFERIAVDAYSRAEIDAMLTSQSTTLTGYVDTAIAGVNEDIGDIEDDITTIDGTLTELSGTVSGHTSSISNLNSTVSGNTSQISTNTSNLTSLSAVVTNLQQAVGEIDTEGYTYEAELDQAEDTQGNTRYRYTLYETKDETTTVKSQFFLPEGGGGGGGSAATSILKVDKITASPIIATTSDQIVIEIDYSSTDGAEEDPETYDGTYSWKCDGSPVMSGNLVQGRNTFNLTNYCAVGTQKLTLTVTDETGNTSVKSWTVQIVNVRIETTFNDRFTQQIGRAVNFTYTPYGAISKTVHFKLDGTELESVVTSASSTLQQYTIPAQAHGSHLLEVWITATINNTNIETNHIFKDIIWYNEEEDDPVIGCVYRYDYYGLVTARQYDTTPIVYNVYDPTTNFPVVKRYVDNVLISTETMETNNATWNYKSETVGLHTLRIECRNTVVTIVMNITELGIDVDPITGGLEIDFNPTGITNNSSNRIWENDNYHMTVSQNFDWANGGYQTDENGDTYFLIKAGTTATFDYEMFAGNPTNNVTSTGTEMKIVFMTENVQDAEAVWLTNAEAISTTVDNTTVTTNMGIQMGVHNGWLKTNKASTTDVEVGEGDNAESVAATNTYLYMPYSEEDIIEMDINVDILDTEDATALAFVMAYEDGVPSKAYIYDSSDRFFQYTPQPITIGSAYCDVRIYRLKIYSTSLTTEGIMKNFIADSRDSTTMLNRYDRNSIYYDREHQEYTPYSTQGQLDPERLAQIIPNVKVLMLETDHFTTSKKTFVKSNLRCIHAPGGDLYPGDPYYDNWYFENGWHSGQGTTSDNYGNAGRNVDFLFNCDGVHNPSDKVKNPEPDYISQVTLGYRTENAHTEVCTDWKGDTGKITLTRTSIPNNFFNLKVNIASSENANNALMQKRYSDFLPYISPAKQRDSRIKNDMEFVPAVLFIKETNPDMSVHNEFLDNDWHFYALGNIGDSKKTDYTRSYDPEDMNEFTIEISDNTKNNATFQTGVYRKLNGTLDYEHFHLVKTLDKDGELVVTPVSETTIDEHIYPVPTALADTLLFQTGTIIVDNQTGDAQYDGNETGYLNMRIWCLYNEAFDGDHSFEPRYACCGDYRDGKLVNDYSGYGRLQVTINERVWRAFYKWVITSTDEQFVNELDQWCVRSAVEFFYAYTLYYTMMDNRAKNTFWHFAKTGVYRQVSRPVSELLHIYEELVNDEYVPTEDIAIDSNKTYYTQYAFDQWGYDMDTDLGIKCQCQV